MPNFKPGDPTHKYLPPNLQPGDQLKVPISYAPFFSHHGIYVGQEHLPEDGVWPSHGIVHFRKRRTGLKAINKILLTDPYEFCDDASRKIEKVTTPPSTVPRNMIVIRALAFVKTYRSYGDGFFENLLGGMYDPISFNCEHLAVYCRTGEMRSEQVERLIRLGFS